VAVSADELRDSYVKDGDVPSDDKDVNVVVADDTVKSVTIT
jgi:hypothetical protein